MAAAIGPVYGDAISSSERIIQGILINPIDPFDYGPYAVDIPFTDIQRDVDIYQKTQMQLSGCSSGGIKKYGVDINGQPTSATFSWWSVSLDDYARDIVMQKQKEEWEINKFFQGYSMYGEKRLILPLNRMMEVYRVNSGTVPVVRILGTFQYPREWMHAFVITTNNDLTFQNHPFAAFWGFDGILAWNPNVPVKAKMGTYECNAFSTVKWDNCLSGYGKVRKWNHLFFAFHLDPLPEKVLKFQEQDVLDVNWRTVLKC